ncbi:TonB-dependent receptor [Methylomonas sp. 2BW1-5-20]|uniref:TonB-dependent receptor n=1 Tax=Methylomonas sp. 2BW1-5-20 TaxID=3376686 RepID=UPI00404DC783
MKYILSDISLNSRFRQEVPGVISLRRQLSLGIATVLAISSMVSAKDVQAASKKTVKTKVSSAKITDEENSELARLKLHLQAIEQKNEQLQKENALLKQGVATTRPPSTDRGTSTADSNPPAEAETVVAKQDADEPAELGEVVLRARRISKLEKLKDTPKSVSIVAGEELEKQNTVDFRDIITRVGNVRQTYTNPQAGSLMIRGVGWATGVGQLDPSVGMTVDGVSYGTTAIGATVNFIDIDSFDVTRGPQGTQGGKNSSIGQINVNTRAPSFTSDASASLTFGERNTIRTQAAVGGPIWDGLLAWRGTFYRDQAEGQEVNVNDRNFSYTNTDRTYGRLQFLLTPSEDVTAKVSLEYTPVGHETSNNYLNFFRATPDFYDSVNASGNRIAVNQALEPTGRLGRRWFAQEKNYTVNGDFLGNRINRLNQNTNNYGTKGGTFNLSWKAFNHTLTSITAYKDYFFDSGGGPISVFDIDRSPSTGHVEYQQFSQELKLSSQTGGFVDYQTGLYLFKNEIPERWTTARYGSDAGAYYANVNQYNRLDANGNGRYLMLNSIDRLFTKTKDDIRNTSVAGYGNLDFHFTDALTVNTGVRLTSENRNTTSERLIEDLGFGAELNPSSSNNVALGGFNSNASGALTTNSAEQLALANSVAQKYFNAANYAALTDAQKQQVADAKAIRNARIGGLYQATEAEAYQKVLPTATFSPSYKITADHTVYFTYQHGEKAGISQIVGATANGGKSALAKEEITNSYEVGFKSSFLDKTLFVAADVYLTDIDNYLQPMYFEDKAQTILNNDGKIAYTSGLGNVPAVQSKGVELDVTYSGLDYTTLRFAGAYNDARYVDFKFLANPLELGANSTPYYDASGKTLPGAAKFSFNLNADYVRPIFDKLNFHTNVNYRFTTSYNNDPSLSRYSVVDAFGITDFAIGVGRRDKLFDASVIVKNLFDTDYGFNSNWNTYVPSLPRWVGVMVSTKL